MDTSTKLPGITFWRRLNQSRCMAPGLGLVTAIRRRCAKIACVSDDQLSKQAAELKERVATGRRIGQRTFLTESTALISEAVRRTTGKTFYDVQLRGGIGLACGNIVEMQTGEGKTLTTAIPAFAMALHAKGVHVATTNAYLAQRDQAELCPALELLGMSVGLLPDEHDDKQKKQAYMMDVTFGTGYEFGFDFLRDQIALRYAPKWALGSRTLSLAQGRQLPEPQRLQREHAFAIVDEVDSVLIDEATMPLVLSKAADQVPDTRLLECARNVAADLEEELDFAATLSTRTIEFTESGWTKLHAPLQQQRIRGLSRPWSIYVENALRARLFLKQDVDYVVIDGEVQIVDQQTGRIHPERTWRDGLHQAVEATADVPITSEKHSDGRISRQRYFQMYHQLAGMTGTATGNENEFRDFYGVRVLRVPTHRPCQRKILPTRFFGDSDCRDSAIVEDVCQRMKQGQPVLVGTRTIHHSKRLADRLHSMGLSFDLLNGVQDEAESEIISRAGTASVITVATNMAGRGTDIKPDAAALNAGGLHVIGAEHNLSQRVDRQLAGRAARQGQPGSAQFFCADEDELFVASECSLPSTRRLERNPGECAGSFMHQVRQIQERLEKRHYQRRQSMVQADNWMENILKTLADRGERNARSD